MHILLTGGSGFVGNVFLHVISEVRKAEFPDVKIDCILRDKRGVPFEERRRDMYLDPKYGFLKNHDSIQFVKGDVIEPNFGMDSSLFSRYTHIVHCAAEISFSKSVAEAIRVNVLPVQRLCEVAKKCPELTRVLYVSTAYVQKASDEPILETIDTTEDIEALMRSPKPENHPNTYCMSKYMAELWLHRHCETRHTIVRPSIIGPALAHPYPGFSHRYSSPIVNVTNLAYSGILSHHSQGHRPVNVIPVDYAAFDMIDALVSDQNEEACIIHSTSDVTLSEVHVFITSRKYWTDNAALQTFNSYTRGWLHRISLILSGKYREMHRLADLYRHFRASYYNFKSQRCHVLDQGKYLQLVCEATDRANGTNPANPSIHMFGPFARWVNGPLLHGIFMLLLLSYSFYAPLLVHAMWIYRDMLFTKHPWNQLLAKYATERINLALFTDITFSKDPVARLRDAKNKFSTPTATVYIASHRSYFDWLIIPYIVYTKISTMPLTIVANAKFAANPIVRRLMLAFHVEFVNTDGGENDRFKIALREIACSGGQILFFPEGTRRRDRTFGYFRKGVLDVIHSANIPYTVVPISVTYQRRPDESSLDAQRHGLNKPFVDMLGVARWLASVAVGASAGCGKCNFEFGDHFAVQPQRKSVESVLSSTEVAIRRGIVVWDEQLDSAMDVEYVEKNGIKRLTHRRRKGPYVMCETERNNWITSGGRG